MLVLSRKQQEAIVIDERITIKVLRIRGNSVSLGIEAPPEVSVHRREVLQRIVEQEKTSGAEKLPAPGFHAA